MTTSESKLILKLFTEPKSKKVLFAEAEKDCVDFLFHILSMPVSTIIRLLKNKGLNCGCLTNLYQSVENLNDKYIQSNQGKDILLMPKSPVGIYSVPFLALNDAPAQMAIYACSGGCRTYVTSDLNSTCPNCKELMSSRLTYLVPQGVNGAVAATGTGFVKEAVKYMVMDDLVVQPSSGISSITGLSKYFNVKDVGALQERVVNLGMEEALKLLKASFESKTVLTSVFIMSSSSGEGFVKQRIINKALRNRLFQFIIVFLISGFLLDKMESH